MTKVFHHSLNIYLVPMGFSFVCITSLTLFLFGSLTRVDQNVHLGFFIDVTENPELLGQHNTNPHFIVGNIERVQMTYWKK